MRGIVVAHGDRPSRSALDAAWPGWDQAVEVVVAADGGALTAGALGLRLDACVGDADSIDAVTMLALEGDGVRVQRASVDKDESDAELAVLLALELGATDLTILAALGGPCFDHALANVALLAHPALAGHSTRLLDPTSRVRLVTAPRPDGNAVRAALDGPVGDLVSLLPWGGPVENVTTSGLRYPLSDEPLLAGPARGLSNVRDRTDAWVRIGAGRLLVVESVTER